MNAFILLLLAQLGFDSRIAYGAAPGNPYSGGDAQFANQQALRELEASTRSVMVRPQSAAPVGFVQQAGGFAAQGEFVPMPGPQQVSYEVAQATFNNPSAAKGAGSQRASREPELRRMQPRTHRQKPAPQPRAILL